MVTINGEAGDKKRGMTLAELEAFLSRARRLGAVDSTDVRVLVNIRAGVKTAVMSFEV